MNDMIAWLNGVLDHRERVAKGATWGGTPWRVEGSSIVGRSWKASASSPETLVVQDTWPQEAAHIALNDPTQIVADVAADRALLALAEQLDRSADCEAGPAATQLYRALAGKYATWPGYRPEWGSA